MKKEYRELAIDYLHEMVDDFVMNQQESAAGYPPEQIIEIKKELDIILNRVFKMKLCKNRLRIFAKQK